MTIILFLVILFGGSLALIFSPKTDVSTRERRKLMSGDKLKEEVFDNLDAYMSDHFPFRDQLISLNSFTERTILRNSSANDVYVQDGYLIEKNYPLDSKSIDNFVQKLSYINENYLTNSRVFYTVIPDKSYFLKDGLKMDFEELQKRIARLTITYINAFDCFGLEDYYRTDIHIKEPAYLEFVDKLTHAMNIDNEQVRYEEKKYDEFYGATYSKVPFVKPDALVYLTNDLTDTMTAWHLEYGYRPIYDEKKLVGMDSYDVFLSGASSLVEMANSNAFTDRELIIFRDSFASSLAPLLLPYYEKITLVDLRYISFDNALERLNFDETDVLFMYSTLLVNNSELLKVVTK